MHYHPLTEQTHQNAPVTFWQRQIKLIYENRTNPLNASTLFNEYFWLDDIAQTQKSPSLIFALKTFAGNPEMPGYVSRKQWLEGIYFTIYNRQINLDITNLALLGTKLNPPIVIHQGIPTIQITPPSQLAKNSPPFAFNSNYLIPPIPTRPTRNHRIIPTRPRMF